MAEQMNRRDSITKIVKYGFPFKGLNTDLIPEKLTLHDASDLQNVRLLDDGNLKERNGMVKKAHLMNLEGLYNYQCFVLPNDGSLGDEAWNESGTFTLDASIVEKKLILKAESGEEGTYYRTGITDFDNSVGTSLFISCQMVGTDTGKVSIIIRDGIKEATFYIYSGTSADTGKIALKKTGDDVEYTMDTTTTSHWYQLTLKENIFKAYVDGVCRIRTAPGGTSADEKIEFGVESGNALTEVKIDYIYYHNGKKDVFDWVKGLWHYSTIKGFNELIAHTGQYLSRSYDNGGNWEWLYGTLNPNYRVHTAMYLEKMYFTNGYNSLLWYDGHTVTRADDELHGSSFPKGKYIAVDENADVMAIAHLDDAPNGVIFSSIVDSDGNLVNPDQYQAWQNATTLELDKGGAVTGIKHFNNMWVIAQRHHLTVVTGFSPANFTKQELKYNDGEDVGCISGDTLKMKGGYLYGADEHRIWRWSGRGPVEDLTTFRIQTLWDTFQKPEVKHVMATTQTDFEGCDTKENIDTGETSGDANIIHTKRAKNYYVVIFSNFSNTGRIKDEDLTLSSDSTASATGYIGYTWGALKTISKIRVKYYAKTASTMQLQYRDSDGNWHDVDSQSPASDALTYDTDPTTGDFTFTAVSCKGLRFNCGTPGSAGDIKVYQMWFNEAKLIGKGYFCGNVNEMGIFEGDACIGTNNDVATIKYYVRYATTEVGLSGEWTEVWVGLRIPDIGSNKWIQWRVVLDRGDETDENFEWNRPTLHFVKLTWIEGGKWTCKPTAVVYDDNYYLSMARESSGRNDRILIYDKGDQWLVDVNKAYASWAVANGNLYAGNADITNITWSTACLIYQDESGHDDAGHSIGCFWKSRLEDFGDASILKNLRRGRVWWRGNCNPDVTLYCKVSKDEGNFANFDTVAMGEDTTINETDLWFAIGNQGYYCMFQIYWTDNISGSSIIEVSGLQIETKMRQRR